jgi:hypothetical protein
MEHTPTPWKAEPFDECRWAVGPDPVRLNIVALTSQGNDEANARHIVRAVNAFKPMAVALNRLISDLTYLCGIDCTGPNPPLGIGETMALECSRAVEMARAAIAKAGGKG